ncbi:MAG TPA: hypothetical protein VFI73_06800 [Candidatus Nitrosopolaris sp.]|nr:hypothetical protein [Candidatus Nitrosopolaris sp.]
MARSNSQSADSASQEKRKLSREMAILSSIFVGLMILAIRPFGFRTFLNGLGHANIFSLLLVASAVAVILVMMQRIGFEPAMV